jgi:hypothetical protein
MIILGVLRREGGHHRLSAHFEPRSPTVHGISKLATHGMHNGMKTAMCSELLVDVVKMVAECLQTDPQRPGDFGRILAICKQAPCPIVIRYCNHLFGELKHVVQQILILLFSVISRARCPASASDAATIQERSPQYANALRVPGVAGANPKELLGGDAT